MAYRHTSAMLNEAIHCLNCHPGGVYVDCTLGGAGHAKAICEKIGPNGILIGIDQDSAAISNARLVLGPCATDHHLFHGNFTALPDFLRQLHIDAVDGILLDLGLSQHQLEASGRGFSFNRPDEPLDMRMDVRSTVRAEDLVRRLSEGELTHLFKTYGEERWAKRIARAISVERLKSPVRTVGHLAQVVCSAVPRRSAGQQKIHPATRVFMALRIAVNQELECLDRFLDVAADCLKTGGRICVLSFHSLEDRIVKHRFRQLALPCTCPLHWPQCTCDRHPILRLVSRKALRPKQAEVADNPMARSTRLRCAEKLA